jgi:hypothetical protein
MSPKLPKTPNSRHSPESWKEKEGKLLGPHSVLLCSNPITHFDFSFTEILIDLEIRNFQKLERKEARAKAKKTRRAETAAKTDGSASSTTTTAAPEASTSTAAAEATPSSEEVSSSSDSSSSSESVSSATGIEADTEESVTSEEESDKSDKKPSNEDGKEKWVAVKGQAAAVAAPDG